MTPAVHVAFRFHVNFYHSYRGDTPDELGFGKDVRIIRHILATLDELNQRGVPVCGTWDLDNYFSLEKIMPAYCPDIIADIQRRAREGHDEIQLMSYNNGLISAHTAREFEESVRRGITNEQGSGLRDLFGDRFRSMVRPQEMMYTPIHLKLYRACGIDAISLFYSALPFNTFSTFVPPLTLTERYNPLTLTYSGIDETMTLMPCYNTGDLADHLTLRRWVSGMRRAQLALPGPQDLLLLLDMDADDDFWVGYDVPVLKGHFSSIRGLRGLVENVADLDYVRFTTPCVYLQDHAPVGAITIGQDTADGSFDGFATWAEKWSNQRLWTGLERARILELQTRRLLANELPARIKSLLQDSFEARLRTLSTTHFGMSAPVMNLTREKAGRDLVRHAVESAAAALDLAAPKSSPGTFSLLDYARGDSTDLIQYPARPSMALLRLPLRAKAPARFALRDDAGRLISSAVLETGTQRELLFVDHLAPAGRKDYSIRPDQPGALPQTPVVVEEGLLCNEFLQLDLDRHGQVVHLQFNGAELAAGRFLSSAVTYGSRRYEVEAWEPGESLALGVVGLKRMTGIVTFRDGHPVRFEREILLAAGVPYVYVSMRVLYPRTPDRGYDRARATRLQQSWDTAWQAIMPCEIRPALAGGARNPLRVWKHNYCDHVSTFSLDYGSFSQNDVLDSVNNQVTHAWVAVSDGSRGLLVAQSADVSGSMAFCPLRTCRQGGASRVLLNPFGSYWGKQYRYATADTGLGNLLARTMADHIMPYAPSYNGREQEFALLIAPYAGDAPPDTVRNDAEAFAYPYLVLHDDEWIAAPAHRSWDHTGLGEAPPERERSER